METIDLLFHLFECTIDPEQREQSKLIYLYSYLTGAALAWCVQLDPARRNTWDEGMTSLRGRYSCTRGRLMGLNQAQLDLQHVQVGLNNLQQGFRSYGEYLKVSD